MLVEARKSKGATFRDQLLQVFSSRTVCHAIPLLETGLPNLLAHCTPTQTETVIADACRKGYPLWTLIQPPHALGTEENGHWRRGVGDSAERAQLGRGAVCDERRHVQLLRRWTVASRDLLTKSRKFPTRLLPRQPRPISPPHLLWCDPSPFMCRHDKNTNTTCASR